ncbi:MAG: hypothetical protein Q4E35_10345 [Eubacteriales bacterium]|nr:hypothetical protein [Eubacteriales bacterium]
MNLTEQLKKAAENFSGKTPPEVTPLTDSQRGVYMECIADPDSVMYNVSACMELPAKTDPELFLAAAGKAIAAHPVLKATIELRDGVPSMVLHEREITRDSTCTAVQAGSRLLTAPGSQFTTAPVRIPFI